MHTILGIDPGKPTGIAILRDGALVDLRAVAPADVEGVIALERPRLVVFEDSRLSPVFHRKGLRPQELMKIGRSVGYIDMQCRDIEDLCRRLGIECIGISPKRKGAKLKAARFGEITGWTKRCNQHVRDAAMVAWQFRRTQIPAPGFTPHSTRRRVV